MSTTTVSRRSFARRAVSGVVLGRGAVGVVASTTRDRFEATLSPTADADTTARGVAVFDLTSGNALEYTVVVADIEDVTEAYVHLHLAGIPELPPLQDHVAWLYPEDGPPGELVPGRSSGVLVEGVLSDDDVVGHLDGSLEELVEAIRSGGAFVHVDTEAFPEGAIEGVIR